MSLFSEIGAVTVMNIKSLPQRVGSSLVTVIGVASVVAVMISLLAVSAGLLNAANKNAHADRAIVLSAGAASEYMGAMPRGAAALIQDAPGVKAGPDGKPLVSPMALIIVEVIKKKDGGSANIGFRGVSPTGISMLDNVKLIRGRLFRPAVRELVAGKSAALQFRNLDVGDKIMLRGSEWNVVGVYDAKGSLAENAIIGDTDTVLAAFDRNAYQSILVTLTSPAAFGRFKDAMTSNPQLSVQVKRETDYTADQLKTVTTVLNFVGYFVGGVMAVGAVFGALNTMYSAVDSRAREIATLRAIGFGGTAVVTSVLVEALMLAVPGALIGVALAGLLFNGHGVLIGGQTFQLVVTPGLVQVGVIWSIAIGLIGGFAPSIRAARLPVAEALRAT